MAQLSIAVFVGSLRRESLNARLAAALERLAPPDLVFKRSAIADLPLYNQDDDAQPTPALLRLKAEIAAAQGLLFVTPEYNRSIPAVLKNAIDHGSRPSGQNAWRGKPAGIVGISPGALGTAVAQQHLRAVLVALDVLTLPQPEVVLQAKEGLFDADGGIGAVSHAFVQRWMERYAAFVRQHAG